MRQTHQREQTQIDWKAIPVRLFYHWLENGLTQLTFLLALKVWSDCFDIEGQDIILK